MFAKTCPVGVPSPGIVTTKDWILVALVVGLTLYKVETPVPLSETQNGLADESEMPQAFTKFGSVIWA